MRTRLPLLYLFIALPVAAQNAFFSRTTVLPVPGINAPLPTAILAADFNQDGIVEGHGGCPVWLPRGAALAFGAYLEGSLRTAFRAIHAARPSSFNCPLATESIV